MCYHCLLRYIYIYIYQSNNNHGIMTTAHEEVQL